ncbi:Alkaline phosphatase synthesis sensor protein PhoR [Novipirellula galeiformis]|uniref:histidine kinase n=1 Tax=Novipirellula galeiformis TaxID=2528004 RepID=A0A5C6CDV1_9BACT|nr:ATP-binding protein [Novipirellula galeiformis]TWU20979.1 Alkaline phosphatase synthesis sensor protein PhoR [Novipirellula galeiformis]
MNNLSNALPSLSSRIVDRYLMCGLAAIFGVVSVALTLAWRGALTESISVTVAVPLFLLLAGSYVMRRSVQANESIENQLQQFTSGLYTSPTELTPLVASTPVATGWNKLLQQINEQSTLASLEQRLGETLDASAGKRWESIFNALSEGVALSTPNGQITLANNALIAMLGVASSNDIQGRGLDELLAMSISPTSAAEFVNQQKKSNSFTLELLLGSELSAGVWRLNRTPLIGNAFEPGSSLWTLRDVTQQKLAEEMRNQFVFTATHELRTPLANIKAYAETLIDNDDIDVERQKGFYNILMSEATRLARFVDDLLDVSQMESGAISVVRHETDVARLIDEVIENVQPQLQEKALTFESKLPAKMPKLEIDKDKIAGVLVNLLSNAAKYTPNGGTVRLRVETDAESIQLQVEDTGIGVSAEELPRLFEKFFRSHDARVQEISGSGLGLAFSQEVARLHGGEISISSELNVGSRFTLTLPLN